MAKEYERPTRQSCSLIDLEGTEQPFPGQRVYALTIGGKLVETVWSERERSFYDAWMPYPDTPSSVKTKQNARILRALKQGVVE